MVPAATRRTPQSGRRIDSRSASGSSRTASREDPAWRAASSGRSEPLEAEAVGAVGLGAEALLAVGLVVRVAALDPDHPPLVLEGQDVSGDPVEEPAVVTDYHGAAREV